MIFEQVYKTSRLIEKHRQAALRAEREQYLQHMLAEGYSRATITTAANYMLHIVRILELNEMRVVREEDLERCAEIWARYRGPFRNSRHLNHRSPRSLIKFARAWFRFHGNLALRPAPPFHELIKKYSDALRSHYGLAAATVRSYSSCTQTFLTWLANQDGTLKTVCISDIDRFVAAKRKEGKKSRSIANQCKSLRNFFRFAETWGWCRPNLSLTIRIPRVPKGESRPVGPTWTHVSRLLKLTEGSEPEQLRARALLLLITVYGLRSSEVIDLRLDDFDWHSEVFTLRRAKNGGIQQYPILNSVGEAILKYIQHARPRVKNRHVFLGERRPWGPLWHGSVWRTVSRRLLKLGVEVDHLGPHCLRHASATQLLKKGSSINKIADFLGHRNEKSVGIYAKFDTRALRNVAEFSLAEFR